MIDVEDYYRTYGPMVLRRCTKLLRDEDEAVDAAQEVFVRLLERSEALEIETPHAYLYCAATRVCLNRIRASDRRGKALGDVRVIKICDVSFESRSQARSLLERLFRQHPESTALMAVLHYVDGMTLAQVADLVGMSVSGVRKRLRNLRQHLHELEEVQP